MNYYNRILALLLALPLTLYAKAQEPKPVVIGACGETSQDIAGYTISFTLGEPVIATAGIITQGFHQPLSTVEYPIISLHLNGVLKTSYILLSWTTSGETNNNWFYIERSTDGISFSVIDSIRTKAPNGNSSSPLNYEYKDLQPANGPNHYRLRQVSKNGSINFSETVQVIFPGPAWRVRIYPNPVRGTLIVQVYSDKQAKVNFALYTSAGQLVLRRQVELPAGYSRQFIGMGPMKTGIYILSVDDPKTKRTTRLKLIRN